MTVATYDLDVDWSGNTDFSGTGENLDMSRVRSIDCVRGRDRASQLTGKSTSGRFKAVLDNRSGDYSSFNTSSAIAGLVIPNRVIRLRGSSVGESNKAIWRGFLTRLVPKPSLGGGDNIAVLEGVGPLGQINQEKINLAMRTSETTNTTVAAILDETQWASGDRTLATGQTTLVRYWADRKYPLQALQEIEAAEAGFIYETNDGKIAFDSRHSRLAGDSLTSQATFSDVSGAARTYQSIQQFDPLSNISNAFEVEVQLYSTGSLATLWTLQQVGADSVGISPGGTFTWWAMYPTPSSGNDAAGVTTWTTPVATTDWTFNSVAAGGGTNITANVAISVTKYGNLMKMIFTNNHASLPAYVQTLKARGTPLTATDTTFIREEDSTSQGKYGDRTWPMRSKFVPNTQEALDWANFHLSIYKDPVPHLSMTFSANRSENHLDEMLLREIGDRVTIRANGDAGLGLNTDFFIERIHHRITKFGTDHRVTYLLSEAAGFSDFWVLNTSVLDTTTRLAY